MPGHAQADLVAAETWRIVPDAKQGVKGSRRWFSGRLTTAGRHIEAFCCPRLLFVAEELTICGSGSEAEFKGFRRPVRARWSPKRISSGRRAKIGSGGPVGPV